jgi:hypothetical protein
MVTLLVSSFQTDPDHYQLYTEFGYKSLLMTAFNGVVNQAFNRTQGLHSVFGMYGVQSITIVPYARVGGGKPHARWIDIGRY